MITIAAATILGILLIAGVAILVAGLFWPGKPFPSSWPKRTQPPEPGTRAAQAAELSEAYGALGAALAKTLEPMAKAMNDAVVKMGNILNGQKGKE